MQSQGVTRRKVKTRARSRLSLYAFIMDKKLDDNRPTDRQTYRQTDANPLSRAGPMDAANNCKILIGLYIQFILFFIAHCVCLMLINCAACNRYL